jgi:hypothetical protein
MIARRHPQHPSWLSQISNLMILRALGNLRWYTFVFPSLYFSFFLPNLSSFLPALFPVTSKRILHGSLVMGPTENFKDVSGAAE